MSLLYPYHSHHFHAPARRAVPADLGFGFSHPWFGQELYQPFAFANQFQLLDDTFNQLSKLSTQTETFAPKFDVKETEEAYELQGELPGVEDKDVSIEFVNDNTLRIKGRTETVKEKGQRPQQLQQSEAQPQPLEQQPQAEQQAETAAPQPSRQATVEDESPAEASGALPSSETVEAVSAAEATTTAAPAAESEPASTEVTKTEQTQEVAPAKSDSQTYWYSERRVGSFQRTFSFPASDVDHDAVKASLKNGILSMTIPKKAKQQPASRKVEVSSDAE